MEQHRTDVSEAKIPARFAQPYACTSGFISIFLASSDESASDCGADLWAMAMGSCRRILFALWIGSLL